jgi:hypothetical protein
MIKEGEQLIQKAQARKKKYVPIEAKPSGVNKTEESIGYQPDRDRSN